MWIPYSLGSSSSAAEQFTCNLKLFKKDFRTLAKQHRCTLEADLLHIEMELSNFTATHPLGFASMDKKKYYMDLKSRKKTILVEKELSIRLKNIATWLLQGDGNTKYFHNLYRHRITNNTIWQLDNGDGQMVSGFDDLAEVSTKHFSTLYKEDSGSTIRNMMDLVAFFLNSTTEEQNELMSK